MMTASPRAQARGMVASRSLSLRRGSRRQRERTEPGRRSPDRERRSMKVETAFATRRWSGRGLAFLLVLCAAGAGAGEGEGARRPLDPLAPAAFDRAAAAHLLSRAGFGGTP